MFGSLPIIAYPIYEKKKSRGNMYSAALCVGIARHWSAVLARPVAGFHRILPGQEKNPVFWFHHSLAGQTIQSAEYFSRFIPGISARDSAFNYLPALKNLVHLDPFPANLWIFLSWRSRERQKPLAGE